MATAAPALNPAGPPTTTFASRPRIVIKRNQTVVILGDSNTAEPRVWFRGLKEWIEGYFRAQGGQWAITFVNSGISGGGISPTLSSDVQLTSASNRTALVNNFNPHALIVACGANDALSANPWSQPDFETEMGASVDNYLANCSHLTAGNILFLPSVYADGEPSGSKETELGQVSAGMSNVATSKGSRYVDTRTGRPTTGLHTSDGTHLTEKGKAYLCSRASEAIVLG